MCRTSSRARTTRSAGSSRTASWPRSTWPPTRASSPRPRSHGVTYDGTTYGVPWAVENVAMLTNKALSPECPATLDEAVANAKNLIAAGKVTYGLGIAMQIGATGDATTGTRCSARTAATRSAERRRHLRPRRHGHRQARAPSPPRPACSSWPTRASSRPRSPLDIAKETFNTASRRTGSPARGSIPDAQDGARRRPDGLPDPGLGGQPVQVAAVPRGPGLLPAAQGQEPGARLDLPVRRGA